MEIISQAIFSRYGLKDGAKLAVLVHLLLLLFFPISYPISKAGKGGEFTHDETTVITGALDLTQWTANDAVTPLSKTYSLDINSKLDLHSMRLIMARGHSRVPIYSGSPANVIGLILVKNLIICRPEDETPLHDVTIPKIPRVHDDLPLYDMLNEFQKGHSQMAVVVKRVKNVESPIANVTSNTSMCEKRVHLNKMQTSAEDKGKRDTERCGMAPQLMKKERGVSGNNHDVNLDSLPSYPSDEEVIGIITMEDVVEQLLQN